MNLISVNFVQCDPDPSLGYEIHWRVVGSGDPLVSAGIFFSSPAIFYDNTNPPGTQYEGTITAICRGIQSGNPVFWTTSTEESSDGGSGGGIPCKQITMSKTVGTPSAHYRGCDGIIRDTLIETETTICTDGHGFTISGGGISIDSSFDGNCDTEYAYFNAYVYACDDCFVPIGTVVVRILRSELPIHVPKFYWADDLEFTTNSYQPFGSEVPAQASVKLSGINTTLCRPC